jgi:integrase/recombinase XerD
MLARSAAHEKGIRTLQLVTRGSPIRREMESFLVDRQARGLSPRSVAFYREELTSLVLYLEGIGREAIEEVTAEELRSFLVRESSTRRPGGVHALYRAVRAFLLWWERETEPEGWRNPISRTAAPKVPEAVLEPLVMDHLKAMLSTCKRRTFSGDRDRALLLCLLDSGCRASEFLGLKLSDVDVRDGSLTLRKTKSKRRRTALVGRTALREIVRYLRHRPGTVPSDPLWITGQGRSLQCSGLVALLRRRAAASGVPVPMPHSFRRGFALAMLRGGADIVSLARLLGHADLSVLRRYLKQGQDDLWSVHGGAGPVDRMGL